MGGRAICGLRDSSHPSGTQNRFSLSVIIAAQNKRKDLFCRRQSKFELPEFMKT